MQLVISVPDFLPYSTDMGALGREAREPTPESESALNHCPYSCLSGCGRSCVGSGVRAAIDCEICSGDVRGLRTCDEGNQGGYLINSPIAAKHSVGNLRRRPIAGSWIQV